MAWISTAIITTPADGDILLDSGALPANAAFPLPILLVTAENSCIVRLEWRNAANAANKSSHIFLCRGLHVFDLSRATINVLVNERLRVVAVGAIEGRVQVSALTP